MDYLQKKDIEVELITQISEMKNYLFNKGYYKSEYDDFELKDNPFTIFIMQNKTNFG